MRFRLNRILPCMMAIAVAIVAFNGAAFAQLTVFVTANNGTTHASPATYSMSADVSGSGTLAKLVFYRNDVPLKTFDGSSSTRMITEDALGQDTYTYRARAYDAAGTWVDSNDVKVTVNTPRVIKMGVHPGTQGPNVNGNHTDGILAALAYLNSQGGGTLFFPCTLGPGDGISRYNIRNTITIPDNVTLQGEGSEYGGRCQIIWRDVDWDPADLPEVDENGNPTGNDDPWDEETAGRCHNNAGTPEDPNGLLNAAMFKVSGDNGRVRFKDLWLHSMSSGPHCWGRSDMRRVAVENTTAIALDGSNGNISDVIFENVSFTNFTYGIKATTCLENAENQTCDATDHEISRIKIRGVTPISNHRQLYIDAKYAYDWDVQNFNIASMTGGLGTTAGPQAQQGAVDIINAGTPPTYPGANKGIKFLQLNCNGDRSFVNPAICVTVRKHGGLYFKQLHHEGAAQAIIVEDISETNHDPIIFEGSVASGRFYDESMKLYLIGNGITAAPEIAPQTQDPGRLIFFGSALNSTVVDCGDTHWDATDTQNPGVPGDPGWGDLRMLFTHSERNRGSLFFENNGYSFVKPHRHCPAGVPDFPNINEVGGEHFDTGVMPTYFANADPPYTHVLQHTWTCQPGCNATAELENLLQAANGGTVYIDGSFTIDRTLTIPSGRQLVGAPGAVLELITSEASLFRVNAPVGIRTSGVTIRNLEMSATTGTTKTTAIEVIGLTALDPQGNTIIGGLSDMHFSGLKISGFTKGIAADPTQKNPMLDGVSMKNMTFVNNETAVENRSPNSSNWNIMDLAIESNTPSAVGWYNRTGGNSLQNVTCRGTAENHMADCIRMDMASTYITGLKQTKYVVNALTVGPNGSPFDGIYFSPQTSNLLIRNSNFSTSEENTATVNVIGRANIVSMNNTYGYFNVHPTYEGIDYQGRVSRLTHCGDTYGVTPDSNYPNTPYHGLDATHLNLYVGVPTKTRQQCGERPVPYEDAVSWGGEQKPPIGEGVPPEYFEDDKPMAGSFFDNDTSPNVSEDLVIYREGTASAPQSKFLIKKVNGPESLSVNWGQFGDKPIIGRFFPNSHDRIAIWRPSNGEWWIRDPHKPDTDPSGITVWQWGVDGDVPFVGNFDLIDPEDEIAVYRPANGTIYILDDPLTGNHRAVAAGSYGGDIHVGDFQGLGHDQIAQYQNGIWYIVNPVTGTPSQIFFGATGDVPVAGRYLQKGIPTQQHACAQLGVWRPGNPGKFIVRDAFPECGGRVDIEMVWGSNNEIVPIPKEIPCKDDIPLVINNATGTLDRPTAYRPTKGAYKYSIANGQWWIHDVFAP